jgi:arginyl-tRNA synthetase
VALAAIKFGDLSNQPSKDYVFDSERFTAFEGKTGPYIQYGMVRIKSILRKYEERHGKPPEKGRIASPASEGETNLALKLCGFNETLESVYAQSSPQWLCQYGYEVCELFNRFYNERNILGEPDAGRQQADIALLTLTLAVLETCTNLLGFEAPERM